MTNEEYQQILKRIEVLMDLDPERDSYEGRELNALVDAVMEYEDRILPVLSARAADQRFS
jgi:antitoxin component HigA of HigAB toxin-antitoxin module